MDVTEKPEPATVKLGDLFRALMMLGLPYLVVGVFWASSHSEHLQDVYGFDNLMSYGGEVVAWPVLIFSDITLK